MAEHLTVSRTRAIGRLKIREQASTLQTSSSTPRSLRGRKPTPQISEEKADHASMDTIRFGVRLSACADLPRAATVPG